MPEIKEFLSIDGNTYDEEGEPVKNNYLVDGQRWIIGDHQTIEEALGDVLVNVPEAKYRKDRRNEYPPVGDQLDALWRGGADAEEMKEIINSVKAKYPKET
tara:strand:+ start:68 stop:370 length:303 start_codon:yes stop_codon:yes gene_type:complete